MFWRAVGIQRLGLPFLSRRRRRGVEHIGIVLSLCSVMLSLLALRMERASLRADVRSAHRRITRANDKLGWASDLAGTTIDRNQALSLRKRNPTRSHRPAPQEKELQMLGDLQDASDIDDVSSTSSSDDQPRRRGNHIQVSIPCAGQRSAHSFGPKATSRLPVEMCASTAGSNSPTGPKPSSSPTKPPPPTSTRTQWKLGPASLLAQSV